jgi:hypothetical protein
MAERWVDDGGNNTTGLSWATAYTSIQSLVAAEPTFITTAGNIVYFGHDSDGVSSGVQLTITGPSLSEPAYFISLEQGTTNYRKGTGKQINTTSAASAVLFDGSFVFVGIRIAAGNSGGGSIQFTQAVPRIATLIDCTLSPGANSAIVLGGNATKMLVRDLVIDLTTDGVINRVGSVIGGTTGVLDLIGLTFINPGYRIGTIFKSSTSSAGGHISSADFSGFSQISAISNLGEASTDFHFSNCVAPAGKVYFSSGTSRSGTYYTMTNVGPTDSPASLAVNSHYGFAVSNPSIYRSAGGVIEGEQSAWLVTTTTLCSESTPFFLPHLYGTIDSTGSKTFDVFLTNDAADLTDAEAWLELEYLATADSPRWTRASDQRATIMTTPVAQDDDTTSLWTGTGPAFTYKQRLRVSAVIGETGMFRARVVFGKASVASSAYLYVDPLVVVS